MTITRRAAAVRQPQYQREYRQRAPKPARKRVLSKKPGSIRQRRARKMHRLGLTAISLWVPRQLFERAIKRRNGLPDKAPISRRHLLRGVQDGLQWWADRWANLERQNVTRDRPATDNH